MVRILYRLANIMDSMTIVKTMFVPGLVKGGHICTRTEFHFIVMYYVRIYMQPFFSTEAH